MGRISSGIGSRDASASEIELYAEHSQTLAQWPIGDRYDPQNESDYLIVIAFDATRSDRQSRGTSHTNPDILEQLVQPSERVASFYQHGVGTRSTTLLHSAYEMASGKGSLDRAEQAYREFVSEVRHWHQLDPNIEPHLVTVGFSRGVGSQRHFANMVEDFGVPNVSCNGYLIEPGAVQQDLMLMFDGVVAGQEQVLDLPIPDGVDRAVHLVAQDEARAAFDLASIIDPLRPDKANRFELTVPGYHGDSGGEEIYGGLSARSLQLGLQLFAANDVPMNELPAQFHVQSDNTAKHEPNSLFPFNWELGARQIDHYPDQHVGPKLDQEASLEQGCDAANRMLP